MRARGHPPLASHYEAALRACARATSRTGSAAGAPDGGLEWSAGNARDGCLEGPVAAALELAKQAEADGIALPKATTRARQAVVSVLDAHLLVAGMAGARTATEM
jgi:hypothetical protein